MAHVYKPIFVQKVWGSEEWIVNNDMYCGKILTVNGGHHCSLHLHKNKAESFHILNGSVLMTLIHKDGKKEELYMYQGDTIDVPAMLIHSFESISPESKILEVSTKHEDEDSYRVSKSQ